MTNKFRGFTLAEVLITLIIIGFVAIIILPALSTATETSKVETSLAKAVNTMENAHMHMAMENESRAIVSTLGGDTYLKELAPQLKGSKLRQVKYNLDGQDVDNLWVLTSDDGITWISHSGTDTISGCTTECEDDYYKKFSGTAFPIIVDVDGSKGYNLIGRDQFEFWIDEFGEVIPVGGIANNNFLSPSGLSNDAPAWETGCKADKTEAPSDPSSCAAAIVENGYKVKYSLKQIISSKAG